MQNACECFQQLHMKKGNDQSCEHNNYQETLRTLKIAEETHQTGLGVTGSHLCML